MFRSRALLLRLGSPGRVGVARGPIRSLAYNIFEDEPKPETHESKGSIKHVAEQIFLQHASGDVITAGAGFSAACRSLALEYKSMSAMTNPAIEGRAFTLFDDDGNGAISRDEFVLGVAELVEPTTDASRALADRLKAGNIAAVGGDFTHVKKVAIIGAGVAGLQVAKLLKKVDIECTIFEKTDDVAGVWRKNYGTSCLFA